jgi:hypothetical protein
MTNRAMMPAPGDRYRGRFENPDKRQAMISGSIVDVTERLFAEFEPRLPLTTIVAVVRECRHELDTAPSPALPELIERLAQQRLTDLAAQPPAAS